jgi:serine/threonine-protein kinase HipA
VFLLGQQEAINIVNNQVNVFEREWQATCDEAGLSEVDRNVFWRRQFLNPYAFLNAPEGVNSPI